MSEQQQQKDLASRASIQEVAGKEGLRTFLIDCSRKTSNSYEAVGPRSQKNTRSSWNNKANGFVVKRGDQVSVEAVAINSQGAAAGTVELNPNAVQGKEYCGNKIILEIGFTLTNNGRYSCILPMRCPSGIAEPNPAVPTTWVSEETPPQGAAAATNATDGNNTMNPGQLEMMIDHGAMPTSSDFDAGLTGAGIPVGVGRPLSRAFCLPSSAAWGWSGFSRRSYNMDGGYSLFRNDFYGGIAGKISPAGGALSQANPWLVDGDNVVVGATAAEDVSPPTNPINTDSIGVGENGQKWSGRNPQAGNDNLQYILMQPDFQPLMGRPANSGSLDPTNPANEDPVVEYPQNPINGRREPPMPEPLRAFVVVDLEDIEFIDVNLLASKFTEAFHQTNNLYRWDKLGDTQHSVHPLPGSVVTAKQNAVPYGDKWGCDLISAAPNPDQLKYIWDGIFPNVNGSTLRSIPANMWCGSNMEVSSPDNINYRENYKTDWCWTGCGIGNSYHGANPEIWPDIQNPPAAQEAQLIGRTGKPYIYNNMIYGNMAVRDMERWKMMFQFFHGDLYNCSSAAAAPAAGASLNVMRTVIMNGAIPSMVINISNGTTASIGGQHNQNVGTPGIEPVGTAGFNLHEVSLIGSTQKDDTQDDYTGNILFTNLEYTEYNVERFSKLFPQGEIYEGEVEGVLDQRKFDPKSFYYELDVGVCDDYGSADINVNPITGTNTAATVPPRTTLPITSFDASSRFKCVTPYVNGWCSRPTTATGGNTGWFHQSQSTSSTLDKASPPVTYTDQWGTGLDHTTQLIAGPTANPIPSDRFHCCPCWSTSGLGGDASAVGKGRSLGRVRVNTRYWSGWKEDMVNAKYEFAAPAYIQPQHGTCDARLDTLNYLDESTGYLSKKHGVACFPYQYYDDDMGEHILLCFRVQKEYIPTVISGAGIATDPAVIEMDTLQLGHIEYQNFFGISNAFMDTPALIPMNSDDQRKTYFGGRTTAGFAAMPQDVPYNYQNYINVGASNATCTFNSDKARFEFSYFYTPSTLSIAYQSANDAAKAGVPQGGTEIATINEEGADASTNRGQIKFYPRQIGDNSTGDINEPSDNVGINDTMSGIFINKVWLLRPDQQIDAPEQINAYIDKSSEFATAQNYNDITADWIEASEENWVGCLLERMGYAYSDIFPTYGSNKNRFNEFNYASMEPFICNESKKPGIMNSKVTVSNALFLDTYFDSQTAAPATDDITGLPLYGLGMNGFMGINQIADSAALRASNLPTLYDTAYYLISTSGLIEPMNWIGLNGQLMQVIFYCLKNYASSDFFYGYASTYSITCEIEHPVALVKTEIRRPDTGDTIPLGENSSVIYKIQRKLELPPILTDPTGRPFGEGEMEQDPLQVQLLKKIVSLLQLQVGEKEGYATLIPGSRGKIGAGGDGRQEGASEGLDEDSPIISQLIQRFGGGGVGRALGQGQEYTQELVNVSNRQQVTGIGVLKADGEDVDDGTFGVRFGTGDDPSFLHDEAAHMAVAAVTSQPEPWLQQAFADAGEPQIAIQARSLDAVTLAQIEADRINPAYSRQRGYLETGRRMRLIMANRNNPFNPAIGDALGSAGDPRRTEELLDSVEQELLQKDMLKHLVRTRLATLLSKDKRGIENIGSPDMEAITSSIVKVMGGSIKNINEIVGLISRVPTQEFYNQLYELLAETFPEYPVFFSATTGKVLKPSTDARSYEAGANAVGISDDALEYIVNSALEQALMSDPNRMGNFGFPSGKGRPTREALAFEERIREDVKQMAHGDQMRILERPPGWSGAYTESPDVLWATAEPAVHYGTAAGPGAIVGGDVPGTKEYRAAKKDIMERHRRPKDFQETPEERKARSIARTEELVGLAHSLSLAIDPEKLPEQTGHSPERAAHHLARGERPHAPHLEHIAEIEAQGHGESASSAVGQESKEHLS